MAARVGPFVGPKPADFNDVQTTSERAVTITCCVVVGVTTLLRTLGRYGLKLRNDENGGAGHYLGLDDVFNFFAVLAFYGLAAAVLIAIDRGMGTHLDRIIWLYGSVGFDRYNLAIYVSSIFYNLVLGLVKLSVLSLYMRILRGAPSRTLSIMLYVLCGVVTCNTVINMFVAAFQCNPIHAAFDSTVLHPKCINDSAFYLGNSITGIITDSMVYAMSVPIVKPLKMDQKRKIVVLITLLVGLFAVVTSCVRLAFLPGLLVNPDASWAMAIPMDWSVVEPTVGILVSSMPAIRSMIYLYNPSHRSGNDSSYNKSVVKSHLGTGHIQLQDYATGDSNTTVTGKKMMQDDDSEKGLIYLPMQGGISKTTEVTVVRE
ncbi:hypothetical protein B7494_g4402 [Chlorociboria aeruginascens]|nr:hypothetical protein B7494_g4402 [Chlorociboria aeruginascens]